MNVAAALLLLILPNDGHWFSGRTETIQVQWNVKEPAAAATIVWHLDCAGAVLASGRTVLPAKDRTGKIQLSLPQLRVTTKMQLTYRVEQSAENVVAQGVLPVHLYPTDLLASAAQRTRGKQLFVWDRAERLPALLKAVGVHFTPVRSEAELQFVRPDMILVGPEQLGEQVEGQGKLMNLAAAGAGVLILRQTRPSTLAGYAVVRRAGPAKLEWLAYHPLTRRLRLFESAMGAQDALAVRLPADEPAQEIAWRPRETPGNEPASIDAMVLSRTLAKGRIVLCQLPLGPWQSDPRSQLFLDDALDYLASPVAATLPPSRRPRPAQPLPAPKVPTIDFSR